MRILVTGSGAICGAGASPAAIVENALAGRSAIAEIASFDPTGWPRRYAAEVTDYNAAKLAGDRKLLKLIRRSDVFGIYAAGEAIVQAGLDPYRPRSTRRRRSTSPSRRDATWAPAAARSTSITTSSP